MEKKAFTLIEILGVLIVLAIVFSISVPVVMNIYESTRRSSFKSDAKIVLNEFESEKELKIVFDPSIITYEKLSEYNLSTQNYESIELSYIEEDEKEKLYLLIIGKNKWNRLVACGTYKEMTIEYIDDEEGICPIERLIPTIAANSSPVNINYLLNSDILSTYFTIEDPESLGSETMCELEDGTEVTNTNGLTEFGTNEVTCTLIDSYREHSSASVVFNHNVPIITANKPSVNIDYLLNSSIVSTYFTINNQGISGLTTTCTLEDETVVTNTNELTEFGTNIVTCTLKDTDREYDTTTVTFDHNNPTIAANTSSVTIDYLLNSNIIDNYFTVEDPGVSGIETVCKLGNGTVVTNTNNLTSFGTNVVTCKVKDVNMEYGTASVTFNHKNATITANNSVATINYGENKDITSNYFTINNTQGVSGLTTTCRLSNNSIVSNVNQITTFGINTVTCTISTVNRTYGSAQVMFIHNNATIVAKATPVTINYGDSKIIANDYFTISTGGVTDLTTTCKLANNTVITNINQIPLGINTVTCTTSSPYRTYGQASVQFKHKYLATATQGACILYNNCANIACGCSSIETIWDFCSYYQNYPSQCYNTSPPSYPFVRVSDTKYVDYGYWQWYNDGSWGCLHSWEILNGYYRSNEIALRSTLYNITLDNGTFCSILIYWNNGKQLQKCNARKTCRTSACGCETYDIEYSCPSGGTLNTSDHYCYFN